MATTFTLTKVLVPLDGSALAEQAVPFAAALAGADATIVFIQVLPEPVPLRDLFGRVTASEEETGEVAESQATSDLHEFARHWAGILPSEPEVLVRTGDAASEILKAAQTTGCELIVAASRGRGALGRLAFGSVADRLTRASTVPVMIVRPADAPVELERPRLRRIVVPYDGSAQASEAFPVAAALAQRLDAPVLTVRVITPTSYTPLPGPMEPFYAPQVLDEMLEEIEAEVKASIDTAVAELTALGADATGQVVTGVPAATLQELAQPGDLIVMTSHGRSGMKRWLLGSVAEQLVREGPVPVLLVPAAARIEAAAED